MQPNNIEISDLEMEMYHENMPTINDEWYIPMGVDFGKVTSLDFEIHTEGALFRIECFHESNGLM